MKVTGANASHFGTINGQGRVVVPLEIRAALGLEPGDRVEFVMGRDGIRLVTAQMLATSVWANNHGGGIDTASGGVRTARTHDQEVAAAKHERTQGNAADANKDLTASDLLAILGVA